MHAQQESTLLADIEIAPEIPTEVPAEDLAVERDLDQRMQRLSREVRKLEMAGQWRGYGDGHFPDRLSSGCEALDRHLPGGGYAPGILVEWLQSSPGCGATSLALATARVAMQSGKSLVVVDWQGNFYPLAAQAVGIDLKRMILIRPSNREEAIFALDQSLRCSAVAAVFSDLPDVDDRVARRLQLAAEQGGTLGLLVRPKSVRGQPSWAEVQWHVQPLPSLLFPQQVSSDHSQSSFFRVGRRLQVELLRCRGARTGATVQVEIDAHHGTIRELPHHDNSSRNTYERSSALHLATQLAMPTSPRQPTSIGLTTSRVASA